MKRTSIKLNFPHQLIVGSQYKIIEPVYDDYDEGLKPETDLVEVIKKNKYGYVLKNIEHNFTYERTFQHLMDCEIEEIKLPTTSAPPLPPKDREVHLGGYSRHKNK